MPNRIIAARYRIEQMLWEDSISQTFQAFDIKAERVVDIRLFREELSERPPETLFRFRNEIRELVGIESEHILKVFETGEFEGREYIVTEHLEPLFLSEYLLSKPFSVSEAIDLVLQISAGLNLLHQKGVIHRTIKPSSVVISNKDGQITAKLTDFGVGLLLDLVEARTPQETIQLFGYMSPEATGILKKPIDERSDIYSLGIIFYQLLTGKLPYTGGDVATLIHQHIAQAPPPLEEINPQIPPIIGSIALRLIAKDPLERYQVISGVTADLEEYRRQAAEGKTSVSFELGRFDRARTLNYVTRLVGREKELEVLKALVKDSLQAQGRLCFVAGEAGIGKSRLIDELREYTYSIGGIFVAGKCYQYEFRAPYKVIAEIIEAYINTVRSFPIEAQEELRGRLKEAVGDLGGEVAKITPKVAELLGALPGLAALDPEKERLRFLITTTVFMLHLSTRQKPMVVFLDDLQWTDGGTVELLEKAAEELKGYPLVIIASYRPTELSAYHPLSQALERLRQNKDLMLEIELKPLVLEDTARLISELLLLEEKEVFAFAKELDKTAKGNPLFIFELLRALVAEGVIFWKESHYEFDLHRLESLAVPENIVEILLKRIKYIPQDDLAVMANASVIGRELLLDVLFNVLSLPQEKILNSMEYGIKNSFLSREEETGKFTFAHDRIREAFYQTLSSAERALLHQAIALYLEQRHKDEANGYLYEIAHHFAQGNIEDKALIYSIKAADKARAAYAHTQALELYEMSRMILEKQGKIKSGEYLHILKNLGEVYRLAGRFDEAISVLKSYDALIPDKDRIGKAEILYAMGSALLEKGERNAALQSLERSVDKLGYKIPQTALGISFGIFWEIFVQLLHRMFPVFFVRRKYRYHPVNSRVALYLKRLSILYFHLDMRKASYVGFKILNISEGLGPSPEYSQGCALMGGLTGSIPLFKIALWYGDKGLEISRQIGDKISEGAALSYLAFSHFTANRHRQAIAFGEKCFEVLGGIGEYWDLGSATCWIVTGYCHTGNLKKSLEWGYRFIATMRKAEALQALGWALGWTLRTHAFIGDLDEKKINELKECKELAWKINDRTNKVWSTVMVALGYLRLRDYDTAIKHIEEARELFPTHNNLVPWNSEIFPVGAQIYIDLLKARPLLPQKEKEAYLKKIGWYVKRAMFISLRHRTYRGWAFQVSGSYLWLKGKKKKALRQWQRGIKFLRSRTEDTYRLASLLLESAAFMLRDRPNDKASRASLLEAQALFSACGAIEDLKTTEGLLKTIAVSPGLESQEALTLKRQIDFFLLVIQAIGSVYNSQELLDKIMDYALKVTGAQRGFVFLYGQKADELYLEACRGIEVELHLPIAGYSAKGISQEILKEVVRTSAVLVANADEVSHIGRQLKELGIKQALCVPLKTKEKLLGVIYFDSQLASGIFDEEKLELMRSFSIQAAISLENARFYSELEARVKERTAELVTLNQVLAKEVEDRKKAEESLQEAYTKLKTMQDYLIQAEKLSAVGQLASGVAHEVRNPLAIIMQGVNYLEKKVPHQEEFSDILVAVKNSVKRADRIVNDLLDFSKSAGLQLKPEKISSILETSLELVKARLRFERTRVSLEIKQDIPKVLADRNKLEQVFINIMLNAVQAMPKGGEIFIRAYDKVLEKPSKGVGGREEDFFQPGERAVVVEIEDTGPGIPAEIVDRVFDPFFTTKGPTGGAGLGLSVSHNIVTTHKGLLEIESPKGKGAKIILTLKTANG